MSTQKTVEIQNNKVLTITARKNGFKPITKSIIVSQNQTQNITMIPSESLSEVFTLGDRLFGISTFFSYFTPSGTYDTTSLYYISAKQTVGTSLTNVSVAKTQWLSYVEGTLSIATAQGTSSSFVFTYNGSTWDLTGATTISGITATELQDNFGITFSGTPTTDDVITVTETYYNKFACFVLDGNYRTNTSLGTTAEAFPSPVTYTSSNVSASRESGTYLFDYILGHTSIISTGYALINFLLNLGSFIVNDIIIKPCIPNMQELKQIISNYTYINSYDISGLNPITTNKQYWSINCYKTYANQGNYNCGEVFALRNQSIYTGLVSYTNDCLPIFELPCM